MAGGIYDHLAGGFARYATDRQWRIPHFEKMLYDNAQLLELYALGYKKYGDQEYARIIKETADFLTENIRTDNGLFLSSINADSEGEEGTYYVWDYRELEKLLNQQELTFLRKRYGVEKKGNWEDYKNILFHERSLEKTTSEMDLTAREIKELDSFVKQKLFNKRYERVSPTIDDKVVFAWNAMTITGFTEAFTATGNPEYLTIAESTMKSLQQNLIVEETIHRSSFRNELGPAGFADDYAFYIRALIDLYEVTFELAYLDEARKWMEIAMNKFGQGENGLFYYTASGKGLASIKSIEINDGVTPSSNAVLARCLFELSEYYQLPAYRNRAERMVKTVIGQMEMENAQFYTEWLNLHQLMATGNYEVAIVGPDALELSRELQSHYLPTVIFMGGNEENLPLLKNKKTSRTLIYVCQNRSCKMPVETVKDAIESLID